jgi:hypothetical protein
METSPLPMKGCKIKAYARRSEPLSREGSLLCHTYCDTGPHFTRSHPKDRPIQSPLTAHLGMWRIYSTGIKRQHELVNISNGHQIHKSYRKYKSENWAKMDSRTRGGIRCLRGVSIPCWPVRPAISPICRSGQRKDIHYAKNDLTIGMQATRLPLTNWKGGGVFSKLEGVGWGVFSKLDHYRDCKRDCRLINYVPLKNYSLRRAATFRLMLGAQGFWAGRDLYRATPAVTRGLGFPGLIRRTAPFCRALRHTRGCGGSVLTRILTGPHSVAS